MGELSLRQRLGLEINRKLWKKCVEEHPLRQLFWETTLRCNLHCRHCGSDCRKIAETPDMPLKDFTQVLDNVAQHTDPTYTFIILTGGEPTLREDLVECGAEISRRGFPWGMVTNGLLLTEEKFRALRNAGLRTATVSLDGLREEHNWMRGHAESFDNALNAIDLMVKEENFLFDIVTCVNRKNYPHLEELKQLLLAHGVKHWRIATVFPQGRAKNDEMMRLTHEEFVGVLDFIKKTRKEGEIDVKYGCEGFVGRYEGIVRSTFYHCQAGVTVGSVLADGSISACPSIRANYHQGNIYKDDFWEVWDKGYQPYRDRKWMKKDECGDCKMFRYCEGNGMHLRDDDGQLMFCNLKQITKP